jgi:hypothetical protein
MAETNEQGIYSLVSKRMREEFLPIYEDIPFTTKDIWHLFKLDRAEYVTIKETGKRVHVSDVKREIAKFLRNVSVVNTRERLLDKLGNSDKYVVIKTDMEEIDIFSESSYADIWLPFQLHELVKVSEGGLIILAGASNSGKTGFLLNTAFYNCDKWEVHYFNSETSVALLRDRALAIKPELRPPLPFKIWDRTDNFSQVVRPGCLNIVDYMDMMAEGRNVFEIALENRKIVERLNHKGVAIVAIQKPRNRELGYGDSTSLFKPELYLALDNNKLKIIKRKAVVNPAINPTGKTWTFSLSHKGTWFNNIQETTEIDA